MTRSTSSIVSEKIDVSISEVMDSLDPYRLEPIHELSLGSIMTDNSDLSSKRTIQKKLESWKKPTPSNALLQFKIDTANLRRQTTIMNTVIKSKKYTNRVKEKAQEVSTYKLNETQDLRERILSKEISITEKKYNMIHSISAKMREETLKNKASKEVSDLRKNEDSVALEKRLEDRRSRALQNKDDMLKSVTVKIKAKFDKIAESRNDDSKRVQDLEEKLKNKHVTAAEKKENIVNDITASIQSKRSRETKNDVQKIKAIAMKNYQKQTLAADSKAKLVGDIATRLQEKMTKISSVHARNTATVQALKDQLEEKLTNASVKKENILKDVSQKSIIDKERYSIASLQRLKEIENKNLERQLVADENKEAIVQSMATKIQEKMDKIVSIQSKKIATVQLLNDKLQQKHTIACSKKESILKDVKEKSTIQKQRYSEASIQKLKAIENKSQQKQSIVAENKEKLTVSVTSKIQEKMNKISNVKSQKVQTVEALQSKLEEKQALALVKKETLLKQISKNPAIQKERYSNASMQKLETMEKKLEEKQATAAENKENIVQSITTKLQEKMNRVSCVQTKQLQMIEVLQDKLYEKHTIASKKKASVLKSVSQKPIEQKERYSEAALQKMKALEEKINHKHTIVTENKNYLEQSRVAKMQMKTDKILRVQAQKTEADEQLLEKIRNKQVRSSLKKRSLTKNMSEKSLSSASQYSNLSIQEIQEQRVKAIEEKIEKKHSVAAENREKVAQNIVAKIQEKMNKVMNAQVQNNATVNKLQEKLEEKHAAAAANKENVMKCLTDKYVRKRDKVTASSLSSLAATKDIEARNHAKMTAAVVQKNSILAGIVNKSVQANQSKLMRYKKLHEDKTQKIAKLKVHHENKIFTAAQKKNSILSASSTTTTDIALRAKGLSSKRAMLENELRLKHESKLRSAEKRRNLMFNLENEKLVVKRKRCESIRKMKMLSRQRKQGSKNMRLESIPLGSLTFNVQNSGDLQDRKPMCPLSTQNYIENKENTDNIMKNKDVSHDKLTGKRHTYLSPEEDEEFRSERYFSFSTYSTCSDSFDWEDEVLSYADPLAVKRNVLNDIRLQPGSKPADAEALKHATEDLASAIRECDVKLSDIQVMQSIILAEEAAHHGKSEFKTLEKLTELETVEISFSKRNSGNGTKKPRIGSRIGSLSKRAAPRLTARLSAASTKAKPVLASRIVGFSRRTRESLDAIRRASSVLDERRRSFRERRTLSTQQSQVVQ